MNQTAAADEASRARDPAGRLERILAGLLIHHVPDLPAMTVAMRIQPQDPVRSLIRRMLRHHVGFTLTADRRITGPSSTNLVLQLAIAGARPTTVELVRRLARLADAAVEARCFVLNTDVDPANATAHQQIEAAALAVELD